MGRGVRARWSEDRRRRLGRGIADRESEDGGAGVRGARRRRDNEVLGRRGRSIDGRREKCPASALLELRYLQLGTFTDTGRS